MSTPLTSVTYPSDPTMPSSSPEGYITPTQLDQRTAPPISSEKIESYRGDIIELILREVVKAVVGFLTPGSDAFGQLLDWAQNLPGVEDLIELIKRLLTPFGLEDVDSLEDAFNQLVRAFTEPFQRLDSLQDFLEDVTTGLFGRMGALEARLNALNLSLDDEITETGGYDNCKTSDDFTPVAGYSDPAPTGWGALTSSTLAIAHYTDSPVTDRHGAGIKVKAKNTGITRLHIAADNDLTNYVALELNVQGNGKDTVSVVTATHPTGPFTTRKTLTMRIPSDSFWELRYEPYDEASETSNTFHVFMNGDPVLALRWKDDGNAVIHGADHRRVGVTLNGLNNSSKRGFAITDFTFYDWLAAAPE